MKILVGGFSCCPGVGSEPGFTWNWVWSLSAHHQVWVLADTEFRHLIEQYLRDHPNPNLRFIWVPLPSWLPIWNPAKGQRGLRLHYYIWQRIAYREATRLHAIHNFDLTHHISLSTVSAPPLLWRLPIPFVWGPVGGGMTSPPAFLNYYGNASRQETMRTLRVQLLHHLPALRQAARHSSLLLATNHETVSVLEEAGASKVRVFLDSGLPPNAIPSKPSARQSGERLTLLWAGMLEPRKALPLALEALTQVRDLPVRLYVAGGGPLRQEWELLAQTLGLQEQTQFLGSVPFATMLELFHKADAFVFTSLRDSFGSVVLEAMSHALPVLALDHQGVRANIPAEAGIKVPVTTPAETVAAIAQGIRALAESPETCRRMGEAAFAYAKTQTWPKRAEQMSHWYEEALLAYHNNGPKPVRAPVVRDRAAGQGQ